MSELARRDVWLSWNGAVAVAVVAAVIAALFIAGR